ncbi:MAG: hypothetical protein ACUVXI_01980 [bacterium]
MEAAIDRIGIEERVRGIGREGAALLGGTFAVAMSVFMLEVALTRLFSVILWYHYVFLVVSTAILGLGLGGLVVMRWRDRWGESLGFVLPAGMALATVVITVGLVKLPAVSFPAFYIPIAVGPFILAGVFLAWVFDRHTSLSNALYFADLSGAATGSLLVVIALQFFGAINAMLSVAVSMAGLAFVLALLLVRRQTLAAVLSGMVFVGSAVALAGNLRWNYLDISFKGDAHHAKTLFQSVNRDGGVIEYTKWHAFSRTDIVAEEPESKWIYTDGGAAAEMLRFDRRDYRQVERLTQDVGFFPFLWGGKDKVLIIGPGGGKDVLLALMGGAGEITGVEINPGTVQAVQRFAPYNGDIYNYENVKIFVGDGRNFIKRTREKYDVIYLSLVFSQVAEMTGFALTENYIYTKEAFAEYMDRLTERGRLVLVLHGESDLTKASVTVLELLQERGVSLQEAIRRMVGITEVGDAHGRPLLIVRKTPFAREEAEEVYKIAVLTNFNPEFIPYHREGGVLAALARGDISLAKFVADYPLNVDPATDDRPFFYNYDWGLPGHLVGLLVLVGGASVAFIGSVLRSRRRYGAKSGAYPRFVFYFAALGIGYMLIEIALIQRLILFLGYPTLTFSVTLFSLLLSGGLGSYLSGLLPMGWRLRAISISAGCIAGLVFLYTFALSPFLDAFLGRGVMVRSLIAMGTIAPLGAFMGVPFPNGLRVFREVRGNAVPLMWGLNGVLSVLGSVLAVGIAMVYGFSWVFVVGGGVYLAAAALSLGLADVRKSLSGAPPVN